MSNMGLTGKIIGIIVLIVVIFSMGLTYNILKLQETGEQTQQLYDHPFTVTINVLLAERDIVVIQRKMRNIFLIDKAEGLDAHIKEIADIQNNVLTSMATVQDRILGKKGQKLIKNAKSLFLAWEPIRATEFALLKSGRTQDAFQIAEGKAEQQVANVLSAMNDMRTYVFENANNFKNTCF